MAEEPLVLCSSPREHVTELVLNAPRKRNAISAAMMDVLADELERAESDPQTRVVILRGAGEHFSSGGDMKQIPPQDASLETSRRLLRRYLRAIQVMRRISKPVIAMADGYVVGGGFSLVLAADLVCVSSSVVVIPAFCSLGIVPEMGILKLLPELVGQQLAKEILMTNRRLGAVDLERFGIANRVFDQADLRTGTLELAGTIAAQPTISIQLTKALMNATADRGLDVLLEAESTSSPFCSYTAETKNLHQE